MLIWINPDQLDLSSPQSEFTTNERTFSSCVLLHRLIITGQDEEILRRSLTLPFLHAPASISFGER